MKYLLPAVIIMLSGCSTDHVTSTEPLEGKWVEIVNRKDTINFDPKLNGNESTYFTFKSDKEIAGYNNLHSAIYEYNIKEGQISIYNMLSSCYCFADYSFTQTGNNIFIENFYDANSIGVVETFEKVN